jgi:hypothetical protein
MLASSLKAEHTLHQWMWDITNSGSGVYLPTFRKNGQCMKENKKSVGMHQLFASMHISQKKGTNYITTKTWYSKQILCMLHTANQNTLIMYFNLGS